MANPNLIPQNQALEFITAGKAIFTVRSVKTQKRFTFKVSAPKDQSKEQSNILFVGVLTGTDNTSDYTYIGFIKRDPQGKWSYYYGAKSRIKSSSDSILAINYVINDLLFHSRTNANLEIWHEGRCCRCARLLTDPESIESGIGPECASYKSKYKKELQHETN